MNLLETGRTYTAIPEWGDIEQALVSMFSAVWEQLEIPALYSEEKLYQTFKDYTDNINSRLGYTPTKTMTLAEFQEIWKKALQVGSKKAPEKTTDKNGSGINPTPFLFVIVLIVSFLFSYTRKRKQ